MWLNNSLTNAQSFAFIAGGLYCLIEAMKALEQIVQSNQADEANAVELAKAKAEEPEGPTEH